MNDAPFFAMRVAGWIVVFQLMLGFAYGLTKRTWRLVKAKTKAKKGQALCRDVAHVVCDKISGHEDDIHFDSDHLVGWKDG